MKGSLLASGLVFGALASSVGANPLEARAFGLRTITKTETTTQTDTVTKYRTKTRTTTETETEVINKTKTKTVVSATTLTVNRPTTVTKTITRNGPTSTKTVVSSTTLVVNRPTTVYKTATAVVTKSLPPTTILSTKTIVSTKTLPVSISTKVLPASTIISTKLLPASTVVSTKTLPVSVSVQTLPVSVSTKVIPASTIISTKVIPASTIVSTKTVQVTGPTVTQTSTIRGSTILAPAQTVTSFSTKEIPGPTITDLSVATITAVSTTYINNGNGTCGSPSSIDGRNMTTSAPPFPTATTSFDNSNLTSATSNFDNFNMTMSATSSSAAASSTAGSYVNVKTATCDSAPAYYIQVNSSGTQVDGTVFCNHASPGNGGSWTYMYPPTSAETLSSLGVGSLTPQPFIFDQETGKLLSYWNNDEYLTAFTTGRRAGLVYSATHWRDPPLTCGLEGSTLVNCGSNITGDFQPGVRVQGSGDGLHMLEVYGAYSYEYDHDATFTLIPACDLNGGDSSPTSTLTTASSTSSSAAATSTVPSYANVFTGQCDNPKGYYIEINDSGTEFDGTVMLNGDKDQRRQWMFYQAPSDLGALGQRAPQPFNFDDSTGMLRTTWSTGEALSVYVIQNVDSRSGFISAEEPGSWMLICSLNGDQLVGCHASETPTEEGLRIETNGMLRAAGGYNYENALDATFRLVPACDI